MEDNAQSLEHADKIEEDLHRIIFDYLLPDVQNGRIIADDAASTAGQIIMELVDVVRELDGVSKVWAEKLCEDILSRVEGESDE